jgi:TRAP-type C4-dicarboxylate transport system substrate-binding protein
VPVPPFLANALQFNREAKYMLDLNWVPLVGAAVIRRDAWEKLSPALRQELKAIAETSAVKIRAQTRAEDDDAITAMKKNGLVVEPVTPAVHAAWQALAERSYPLIRGTLVPAEIFDEVTADLAAYRAAHG